MDSATMRSSTIWDQICSRCSRSDLTASGSARSSAWAGEDRIGSTPRNESTENSAVGEDTETEGAPVHPPWTSARATSSAARRSTWRMHRLQIPTVSCRSHNSVFTCFSVRTTRQREHVVREHMAHALALLGTSVRRTLEHVPHVDDDDSGNGG
ncbi:hypothetical protein PsorP6_010676 [Peronosclerospora sorghi]|uniref:Uncharacterized protein n=1 Tax=Peronosclerospora sorghi TaxID=230839 RepID=A0ACC0VX08_9STRA|nr:hypothetical protein PsorP6_010676 [Peronosclerospora sorghi]